ncbi:MAG: right-handed parallel beta-helix repeat-containing protein [Thermoplasmata archaeon]|nr:MAG: right-handed parallel beta-helix repeat-containing protein [Thermoplasmata archaeon]
MRFKVISVMFIIIILMGSGAGIFQGNNTQAQSDECEENSEQALSPRSSYTGHSPIYIHGNESFTKANGVVAGSGSSSNPYLIQGWEINTNKSAGIVLQNISAHFIIQDCYIHGNSNNGGIIFSNVSNGAIKNNMICNNSNGISYLPVISGKEICERINVSYNKIIYNRVNGILFEHVGGPYHMYNNISNNNISFNGKGISIIMSAENLISYNDFYANSGYAVLLDMCLGGGEFNHVHHNNFIQNNNNSIQASNQGGMNLWNHSSGGNYWSDYLVRYPNASKNGSFWNMTYVVDDYTWLGDHKPLVNRSTCQVQVEKPTAVIVSVGPNPAIEGQTVYFNGYGSGNWYIAGERWSSDLDGLLSTERIFETSTLSIGTHTISFTVQNKFGLWSEPEIVILTILKHKPPFNGSYEQHEPIKIVGNENFTIANGVFAGSGSENDPYIIEGWGIFAKGEVCIDIWYTDAYFVIRNCYLYDGKRVDWHGMPGIRLLQVKNGHVENVICTNLMGDGLYLRQVENCIIRNNNFSNDYASIDIEYSKSITVINNNCSDSHYGIHISHSTSNTISNNNFNNSVRVGATLVWDSDDNTVSDNYCNNAGEDGIYIWDSDNNIIVNNICKYNNWSGIAVRYCNSNILKDNIMSSCGVFLEGDELSHWITQTIDTSNIVNGKPVYYYKNQNGATIPEGAGQIILANCQNMVVENQKLSRCSVGIQIGFCNNITLINNDCNFNSRYYGIRLAFSDWNTIKNNNCNFNHFAGIILGHSNSNTIINNSCNQNTFAGIELWVSSSNTISDNFCVENYNDGIELNSFSCKNIISYNSFINNSRYGINITSYSGDCSENYIHHNNFINNNNGGIQANDKGSKNDWNTHQEGNYWSDWVLINPEDPNPYYLEGESKAKDYYPIGTPSGYLLEKTRENITIQLILDKTQYFEGEAITGELKITNNNYFDVYTTDPAWYPESDPNQQSYGNIRFEVTNLALDDVYYASIESVIKINKRSSRTIKFSLADFYDSYSMGAQKTSLKINEYLIQSNFLVYMDSNAYVNCYSGEGRFRLSRYIPGIDNITIILELAKSEFYADESISGTLKIINNNSYDITLIDPGSQRLTGHHFDIFSITSVQQYLAQNEIDLYPIEVKAHDSTTINFKIDKIAMLSEPAKNVQYIDLTPGDYSIHSYFYYGELTDSEIIYSNYGYFTIIENLSVPADDDGESDPDTSRSLLFSSGYIFGSLVIIVIMIVIISAAFIGGTEVGKYGFFSAVAPLYTKHRKKKDMEYGYIKGSVRGYIVGNPGESYNTIKKSLGLPNGTLSYYLKVLERESIIQSERDGKFKRFYPADGRITSDVLELTDVQQDIYTAIETNPGVSQKDIQEQLDISQQRLNYQIKIMTEARLIRVEREGKRTKCYVVEEN